MCVCENESGSDCVRARHPTTRPEKDAVKRENWKEGERKKKRKRMRQKKKRK